MKTQKFKISKEEAGLRLDVFLTGRQEDLSRSWIQKLIEKGNVRIGPAKPNQKYKLKEGETVTFTPELPPEISLDPDQSLDNKIGIVFENDNFLVINKPAGIVVHPSSTTPNGTIVNWLLWRYPKIKRVGDPSMRSGQANLRPGLVHRLDKETSGLMVVAKNQKTFRWLKQRFQNRQVTKKYLALVVGLVEEDTGIISYPVGRSKKDPTKQTVYKTKAPLESPASPDEQASRGWRPAETHWRVEKRFPEFTYLELTPKTGRMHQIRVHLKSIGHPVAGDEKYADRDSGPKHLGRMFLHSSFLGFTTPQGEKFSFNAPLAAELKNALKNLPYVVT